MTENEPIIWINGELRPASQARISPLDRGFTVGCGVFETLCARDGELFAPARHWRRLVRSCQILGIRPPLWGEFINGMKQNLQASGLKNARVRFTVTAGETPGTPAATRPNCIVHAVPLQHYPRTEKAVLAPWPRNERSAITGAKCTSYAENILALQYAHDRRAGEALFGNTRGELCEGATTNVFLVRKGRALTPSLSSGCLPGITRELVLEICRAQGQPVQEKTIPLSALKTADEAFLTSSTRGIQPLSQINGRKLAHAPGATTRRIRALYRKFAPQFEEP